MTQQKPQMIYFGNTEPDDRHAPFDQVTLERRLDDGYQRIEEAQVQGRDVRAWEDFWLQLLHEYEEICDGLRRAA